MTASGGGGGGGRASLPADILLVLVGVFEADGVELLLGGAGGGTLGLILLIGALVGVLLWTYKLSELIGPWP